MQKCGACEIARYAVSAADSTLDFAAASTLHAVHGSASSLSGYMDADVSGASIAVDPPPRMHIEVPVEHLRSGNPLQDRELWKLIDSRRFPTIAADLRRLEPDGSGAYAASGDITLAGRQRRYEGMLTVERSGERLRVTGNLVLDIRDFGLKPPRLLMMKVEPCVNVRLQLVAAAKN